MRLVCVLSNELCSPARHVGISLASPINLRFCFVLLFPCGHKSVTAEFVPRCRLRNQDRQWVHSSSWMRRKNEDNTEHNLSVELTADDGVFRILLVN